MNTAQLIELGSKDCWIGSACACNARANVGIGISTPSDVGWMVRWLVGWFDLPSPSTTPRLHREADMIIVYMSNFHLTSLIALRTY